MVDEEPVRKTGMIKKSVFINYKKHRKVQGQNWSSLRKVVGPCLKLRKKNLLPTWASLFFGKFMFLRRVRKVSCYSVF